jgi:DNA-binding PadR family transcriptional regulator
MKELSDQEFVVLGIIMDGATHGYEICQSELNHIWHIPISQTYALLRRLEQEKMVTFHLARQGHRPQKKVYALTNEGRMAFLSWVKNPAEKIRNIRTEFLSKLFLIRRLRLDVGTSLIMAQLKICKERKKHLNGNIPAGAGTFENMVSLYRHTMIDATIHWLKGCLENERDRI